ncbi:MAG: hypothetical protein KIT56_01665 [Gammaproteobacteria bacterium]|nr:hypothetical protein [Gammaproteobacteria bacterium]MCW5582591.1 hypothetical protein [Gammaproteobacteria bacterium]
MSFLRPALRVLSTKPNYSHVQKLRQIKKSALSQMQKEYPHILISTQLNGKIAYMLRSETPDQIIAAGGFTTTSNIWLSNITGDNQNTCNSSGTICLTLLPEITTIFLSNRTIKDKRHFIYAIPLEDELVFLGGKWRQIISPGALPLPLVWRSREVLRVDDEKVTLGPILGQGKELLVQPGERYAAYSSGTLNIPKSIGIGEDYPEEYEINDTEMTQSFQSLVNQHYQEALYVTSRKCEL